MDCKSERVNNRQGRPELISFIGIFCVIFIGAILFFVNVAQTAVPPEIITYQGKLLVGGASATTSQNMYFVIFDAPTGGNALYSAAGTTGTPASIAITPSLGLFTVGLGDAGTNALDPTIFKNNDALYLEVQIGAETLSPRKRLTSAPYAFNSKYLDGYGASQSATDTAYIPVADAFGNFDFRGVTSTNVYSSGNVTASNSMRSDLYCDVNGANCFDPTSGWATAITQVVTTTATYNGVFATGSLTGYLAANNICEARLSGSHLCETDELLEIIREQDITFFGTGNIDGAWIAEGPPGFTANANDCNGWKSALDTRYGPFWVFDSNGGGMGWLAPCNVSKPLACCK